MSISVIQPILVDFRKELYDYYVPWRISDRIFNEMEHQDVQESYKKVQVLPTDPEWRFVWRYFHHDKPNKYRIKRIYCIHQKDQQQTFELNLSSMEAEANTFKSIRDPEPRTSQQDKAIERWKQAVDVYSPFDVRESNEQRRSFQEVKILPLWYGSSKSVLDSIVKSGSFYFEKTVPGKEKSQNTANFLDSGIYFTSSARYAADTYSEGDLFLAWVSMREPFPVVEDSKKEDIKILHSKEPYKDYNTCYIHVTSTDSFTPLKKNYYPTKEEETLHCDEIVVFQQSQILPRFWIELEVELTSAPSGTPKFVNELIPHIMKLLQNPNVDRNQKLRDYLGIELGALLKLEGNDDLEESHKIFYEKLTRILDQQGKVNKQVRHALTETYQPTIILSTTQSPASVASTPQPAVTNQSVTSDLKFDSLTSKPNKTHKKRIHKKEIHSKKKRKNDTHNSLSSKPIVISNSKDNYSSIPSIAFGKADWEKFFGNIGEEPPLPVNIEEILNAPCSFWPDKKVKETHLLVLIPNTVNGNPFTLNYLEKLIQTPNSGHFTKYKYYDNDIKKRLGKKSYPSHWILMTKDVVPGSRNKSYSKQCDLIAKHCQKAGFPSELPSGLEITTSTLMHYVKTGETLYTDDKLGKELTYARCKDTVCNKCPLNIGGFSSEGLNVAHNLGKSDYSYGVAGVRKL